MSERSARVTALVDQSAYAASVAEHAAWLCGRLGGRLQLRHAREPHETVENARRVLVGLDRQVTDQGAGRRSRPLSRAACWPRRSAPRPICW